MAGWDGTVTRQVKVVEPVAKPSVALTTTVELVSAEADGVPVIAPVPAFIERPAGNPLAL